MRIINEEELYRKYIIENKSQKSIAEEINCSRETIKYYAKLYGIKKDKKSIYEGHIKNKPTPNEIKEYLKLGYTTKMLAKDYNISSATVRNIARDNNINLEEVRGLYKVIETNNKYKNFDNKMSYKEYRMKASSLAKTRHKGAKPEGCVIDHMFSVYDGYNNNVPLSVISNPNNLRVISQAENILKGSDSIITLEQLYEEAENG